MVSLKVRRRKMKDEMDILKEAGSMAAAHASTALSAMLQRQINLHLPSVDIISSEGIEQAISIKDSVIILQNQILAGLKGKIIIILEEKSAYKLLDLFYKTKGELTGGTLTEMGMSLIKEFISIIVSAYINTLGTLLKKVIIPSLPIIMNTPFTTIIKLLVWDYQKERYVLLIKATFEEPMENIQGNIWLILTPEAAEEIKSSCKKILEELET